MSIKKVFNELNQLLSSNQDVLVKDLMPKLLELMSAKTSSNGPASYRDSDGKVVAIYCYYHKVWELVEDHEYGAKAGTNTGLNTMCKVGVNAWTKQQREFKKAQSELLTKLASGELAIEQLSEAQVELETKKNAIVMPENFPKSFETLEMLEDFLENAEVVEAKPTKKARAKKVAEVEETN